MDQQPLRAPSQRGQPPFFEEKKSIQPVNLPLGVFSRAEQQVLQAIFKAIAEGGGRCIATLEMLARDSNTGKTTTRNAIAPRSRNRPSRKDRAPLHCAVSLPNVLSPGKLCQRVLTSKSMCAADLSEREWPASDAVMNGGFAAS